MNKEKNPECSGQLRLDARLVIDNIGELHRQLVYCAGANADIELLAAGVETVDTSALQVLLAFCRDMRAGGHKVTWRAPARPLLVSAALAGLSGELDLPGASG